MLMMDALKLASAVVNRTFQVLGISSTNITHSANPYTAGFYQTHADSIITDLMIRFSSPNNSLPASELDSSPWHRIEKDLYLHSAPQSAWLHIAHAKEDELTSGDLLVVDIKVGETAPDSSPRSLWERRLGGIWVLRSKYTGDPQQLQQAVTAVDILFGEDAVDPRPQWNLMQRHLQLLSQSEEPAARLTVLHGRVSPSPDAPQIVLRAREDGQFKILQISDTHMVTGPGVCKDAIDADGIALPESVADPLTVEFLGEVLDAEKPDLVVFTGDQVHHDVLDTQSALFKVVAPVIERAIPWAAVFGNHDSEGTYALTRAAQMSLLQSLPFSLCQSGPEEVDGVGNHYLQILDQAPSQSPSSTLYLLDSHGQIPSWIHNPDYDPIKPSQIDWFTKTSHELKERRIRSGNESKIHLSMAFLHIPFPEFDDKNLTIYAGRRREPTEGPSVNSHFYDALVKEGVSAVACGHDHVNDFCALLPRNETEHSEDTSEKGPWLCYVGGGGFGGYCSYGKDRFNRRTRVWELDTKVGSIKTWKRLEYNKERVDELLLVQDGKVIDQADKTTKGGDGTNARAVLS